jgi:hypothetical protein
MLQYHGNGEAEAFPIWKGSFNAYIMNTEYRMRLEPEW